MTNMTFTRSALLPLLLLSGNALADITAEQLKNELVGSEGRIQQTVIQGQQKLLDNGYQMDNELKLLQAQQEKTRQSIQELKSLQQQLSKQMQQVVRGTMSSEDKGNCPIIEPGLTTQDGKLILGESEWVYIDEANGAFQTRVDTGAATSSISATDITVFEREGKRWVKFKMPIDGGKSLDIEAPFVRYVRIKQASAESSDRRPVVRLTMQIGSMTEKAEFSLKDRSEMDFSVLLGREFIKDVAVVDVAREFVQPKPDAALNVASKKAAKQAAEAAKKAEEEKKAAEAKKAEQTKKASSKKTDAKKAEAKKSDSKADSAKSDTSSVKKPVAQTEPAKDAQ
ncbi:ATP-dependent zinc protease [Pseudaeromonas sharmana]|uniref:ATP-dependent zinc protease n=1 Tax=Pseudaeromonas sharmana TaxID=328412 RepID=A0ABV8CQN9_9GAMM